MSGLGDGGRATRGLGFSDDLRLRTAPKHHAPNSCIFLQDHTASLPVARQHQPNPSRASLSRPTSVGQTVSSTVPSASMSPRLSSLLPPTSLGYPASTVSCSKLARHGDGLCYSTGRCREPPPRPGVAAACRGAGDVQTSGTAPGSYGPLRRLGASLARRHPGCSAPSFSEGAWGGAE